MTTKAELFVRRYMGLDAGHRGSGKNLSLEYDGLREWITNGATATIVFSDGSRAEMHYPSWRRGDVRIKQTCRNTAKVVK